MPTLRCSRRDDRRQRVAAVGTESAPRDAQLVALQETVSKLKEAVTKLREENTTLKRKNQAAVTVIAELSAQLQSPAAMSQPGPSHP
jgi:predicted RNase H-like nuclease (RuvC/YqgF family)